MRLVAYLKRFRIRLNKLGKVVLSEVLLSLRTVSDGAEGGELKAESCSFVRTSCPDVLRLDVVGRMFASELFSGSLIKESASIASKAGLNFGLMSKALV